MKTLKLTLIELRKEGKSYSEIQKITGASKGTIAYHCGTGQKEKYHKRMQIWRKKNSLKLKIVTFKKKKGIRSKVRDFQRRDGSKNNPRSTNNFYIRDVIAKFGNEPKCYLTGDNIDLTQPSSYCFDHYIPATKGGSNELDNLKICTAKANRMKSDLFFEELIEICQKILITSGYNVSKIGTQ